MPRFKPSRTAGSKHAAAQDQINNWIFESGVQRGLDRLFSEFGLSAQYDDGDNS